jgi:hypothetical protein
MTGIPAYFCYSIAEGAVVICIGDYKLWRLAEQWLYVSLQQLDS